MRTNPFRESMMSPYKAIQRYETMSLQPRSPLAWAALARRLHVAAAYARYQRMMALAEALIDLAEDCLRHDCEDEFYNRRASVIDITSFLETRA